jgi:hypothetical protein
LKQILTPKLIATQDCRWAVQGKEAIGARFLEGIAQFFQNDFDQFVRES